MKVLVADPIDKSGVEALQAKVKVDVKTGLKPDELKSIIGNYDALIVRSETRATADIIDADPPEGFVYVKDVSEKTGKSSTTGKDWTLYIVKFSDGREASTFDGPISITAKAAMASHVAVIPTLQPSGKGQGKWNLVNLLRA